MKRSGIIFYLAGILIITAIACSPVSRTRNNILDPLNENYYAVTNFTTNIVLLTPSVPDVYSITTTSTQITLSWYDAATNEYGYRIYISANPDKPSSATVTLAADETNYTAIGLTTETLYYIWVEAFNYYGTGDAYYNNVYTSANWVLVWNDEFNGSSVDTLKWNHETGGDGWGNNEWEYYTNREDNSYISNGNLVICALEESYGERDYTSARMTTRYKGDFLYGKIEARIILPYGQGIWPAFWMMPTDSVYGGWPHSGEIDIMEFVGKEPNTIYGTVHRTDGSGSAGDGSSITVYNLHSQYHVFTIEWDEDEIKWFVDGVQFHNYVNAGTGDDQWPFDQEFYIILNLAVGGYWPGYPDATTVFPQKYVVDWVRVYEKQ